MIDERTAWRLVRALADRIGEGEGLPVRVGADTPSVPHVEGEPKLEVDAHGAWSVSGALSDEARDLFDLYVPLASRERFVVGQLGQSLDGRIATETGASHYVTGPEDIRRLHRLRALVDAVIVGAGTVAADDPRLTVREVEGPNPVRVVIDPEARLDPQRRIFQDGAARTMLVRRAPPEITRARAFGDEIVVPSPGDGRLELSELIHVLREQGLGRVLVEGGGITVSRFLQAGLLDRLHVCVAPMIIGSGKPSITLEPIRSLSDALRPKARHFRLGDDVLFDLDFGRRTR
jgi:riboflavin-specific deaminase-like protein